MFLAGVARCRNFPADDLVTGQFSQKFPDLIGPCAINGQHCLWQRGKPRACLPMLQEK
jgi:hypothetical protein